MADDNKIKLKVLGITETQVHSDVYALVMTDEQEQYHIPIVIGTPEAQAIHAKLQSIILPRPLTHDTMATMMHAFGIELGEVDIYEFSDGVFKSRLVFHSDDKSAVIEARTSDAVALALRTGAPIFTNAELLHTTGFNLREAARSRRKRKVALTELSVEELQQRLNHHVELEEYELAAKIQKIIKQKQSGDQEPDTPSATTDNENQ